MSKSFEEQILSDVVKQVMTPEKLKAMADRLGPQIEKKMEKAIVGGVDRYLDDMDWYDMFYENDFRKHFTNIIKESMGIKAPAKKAAAKKRR